jgi:DNA-binding transcriptional ArsR family regulator
MAQVEARLWLGKFTVTPAKVLYIAREDPLRRVQERMVEICNSYGMPLPETGRLQFLVRERISLTDIDHIQWLKNAIRENGFEFLILDVINRMHPDLDELSAKDMGKLVGVLEELNRELDITILSDDHTRKPQGRNTRRDSQEPNPFDMKGSMAKYGCADFMICLSRTPQSNRMQVYCENKDTDERPHFLLDVSAKGSSEPKFQYAGSIEHAASDMRQMGEDNRAKVLGAYGWEWRSRKDVAESLSMSASTVAKHTADLLKAGKLEQRGKGPKTQYRQSSEDDKDTPRTKSDKGFHDNG